MSKRRRGYPSETRVKRGDRVVHGDKEFIREARSQRPLSMRIWTPLSRRVVPEERALRWVPQELLLTRLIATIPSCGLARLLARLASLDALAEFAVPAFCAVENPGTCPRGPLMSTGGSLDPLADHRCAGASTPHSQYLPHLRQPQCSYGLTVAGKDLSTSVGPSPEARSRASEGSGATNQWAVLLRASRAPSGRCEGTVAAALVFQSVPGALRGLGGGCTGGVPRYPVAGSERDEDDWPYLDTFCVIARILNGWGSIRCGKCGEGVPNAVVPGYCEMHLGARQRRSHEDIPQPKEEGNKVVQWSQNLSGTSWKLSPTLVQGWAFKTTTKASNGR